MHRRLPGETIAQIVSNANLQQSHKECSLTRAVTQPIDNHQRSYEVFEKKHAMECPTVPTAKAPIVSAMARLGKARNNIGAEKNAVSVIRSCWTIVIQGNN